MPTYIILTNHTEKGIEHIKQGPERLDSVKGLFKKMGAELKGFYLVQGRYDIISVAEAPNDETVAKLALAIGSQSNFRTETMRAFSENEYHKIISALP